MALLSYGTRAHFLGCWHASALACGHAWLEDDQFEILLGPRVRTDMNKTFHPRRLEKFSLRIRTHARMAEWLVVQARVREVVGSSPAQVS